MTGCGRNAAGDTAKGATPAPDTAGDGRTVREALDAAAATLSDAGIGTAALDARLLLQQAAGLSREDLIRSPHALLSSETALELARLIARRARREPLALILGMKEFWGLEFEVAPGVLIPRPDSETLISAALEIFRESPPETILDLGSGSGCLPISLLTEWPETRALAVDRSAAAVALTARNARRHGVSGRLGVVQGDWGAALAAQADLVTINPPYIPHQDIKDLAPDVKDFEPHLALDGGPDGLEAFRSLAAQISALIRPGGAVLWEVGKGQAMAVAQLAESMASMTFEKYFNDLAGLPRVVFWRA